MLEEKDRIILQEGMRTAWIIWAALFVSLGIYLIIAHLIGERAEFGNVPESITQLLRYVLMGAGAVILFLARFIRKIMLKGGAGITSAMSGAIEQAANTRPVVGRYISALLVSLSLAESVGIFGLVLFFLSKDFQTLYLFVGCSALAMYFYRPKMEELEGLLQRAELHTGS